MKNSFPFWTTTIIHAFLCVRSDGEELRSEALWEGQANVCDWPSRLWPSAPFSYWGYTCTVSRHGHLSNPNQPPCLIRCPKAFSWCCFLAESLNMSCYYQIDQKSVTCEWSGTFGSPTQPELSLIFRRWRHHTAGKPWCEQFKVNLPPFPSVTELFTPVWEYLAQLPPTSSQPRWKTLWWTLRSGLSLSPYFFLMQVRDYCQCCNSRWYHMLKCVSALSQTFSACINCPRLHC